MIARVAKPNTIKQMQLHRSKSKERKEELVNVFWPELCGRGILLPNISSWEVPLQNDMVPTNIPRVADEGFARIRGAGCSTAYDKVHFRRRSYEWHWQEKLS
jgi:hypothetical protein